MRKPHLKPKARRSFSKAAPKDQFWIDSTSAFKEYLKFKPESLLKVEGSSKHFNDLKQDIESAGLNANELFKIDDELSFRALVKLKTTAFDQVNEAMGGLCLALDHIEDPRNMGAILRSAAFFGIKSVLIAKNRQVGLTQASVSTSMGALARVDVFVTGSLASSLNDFKDSGYQIIGARKEDAEDVAEFTSDWGIRKSVLVLGSEAKGLSHQVSLSCDRYVSVHSSADFDSLNVSVAAGILMHRLSQFGF